MLKRNLLLTLRLALIAGLLATSVSSWQSFSASGQIGIKSIANGLVDGFLIVGLVAGYKLLVTDFLLSRFFSRVSVVPTLLINSFVYSVLILFGRAVGRYLMEYDRFVLLPIGDEQARLHFFQAFAAALIFSLVLNFLLQNSRLLGPRVLANFITGRYHRPRIERRIVAFMDLKSSTTIAERLGDTTFLGFISDAFADMTEPIIKHRAEIYKYVGDEVILTWPIEYGIKDGSCVRRPLELLSVFQRRADYYRNRYGYIPEFRTGIHIGELVIGEVGVLKREIALIGDVMNTAARIAAYSREAYQDVLISADLHMLLPAISGVKATDLGSVPLKGKSGNTGLFAVFS